MYFFDYVELASWILTALSAVVPLILLYYVVTERRARYRTARAAQAAAVLPLDDKVAQASELSRQLSELNTDIRAEYELRIAEILKLKEEADEAQALASISREAREAADKRAAATMDQVLAKRAPSDRWFQFFLSLGAFAAGVVVTIALQGGIKTPTEDVPSDGPTLRGLSSQVWTFHA